MDKSKKLVAYFSCTGTTARAASALAAAANAELFEIRPIWWYVAPRIVETFLESYDFDGKTVVPFFTSGGSGAGRTDSVLQQICPSARWKPSKRLSANVSEAELKGWLDSLNV